MLHTHASGPLSGAQKKLPAGAPLLQAALLAAQPHTPPRQLNPGGHTTPQPPQLFTSPGSAFNAVSQPSSGLLLQLPNPALHCGAHDPLAQAVVPLTAAQAWPHAPQLVVVVMSTSQPSSGAPLQSHVPAGHARPHAPAAHEVCPLGPGHTWPQTPQWAVLAVVSVSHPVWGSLSQSPKPWLQASVQTPAESQPAIALAAGHGSHAAAAQPVAGSLVETQAAPQRFVPVGHDPPVPELEVLELDEVDDVPELALCPPLPPSPPLPAEVDPAGLNPAVEKTHAPSQAARPPRSMGVWAGRMDGHHGMKRRDEGCRRHVTGAQSLRR